MGEGATSNARMCVVVGANRTHRLSLQLCELRQQALLLRMFGSDLFLDRGVLDVYTRRMHKHIRTVSDSSNNGRMHVKYGKRQSYDGEFTH